MIGEIIGSAISAAGNIGLAKQQYEYSKQLAAQQNQYNIDMWRMNNEYNTPAAQMRRFQEAGLNPNLIYGQGTAGNSASAPQQVTPEAPDYSHAMSDISKFGQLLDIANRIENLRAQRKANELRDREIQGKSLENSSKDARQQLDWMRMLGYVNWADRKGLAKGEGNATQGGKYFESLYEHTLDKIMRNNLLTSERRSLLATQETLNNLQSNYYRVRNAWQPWQYGVDLGSDILGSLVPFGKLFKRGSEVVKNYNRNYNSSYNYNGQYRIGHNYINQ